MSWSLTVTAKIHRTRFDADRRETGLYGAKRNRYGIIGPIYPQEMQPETFRRKSVKAR